MRYENRKTKQKKWVFPQVAMCHKFFLKTIILLRNKMLQSNQKYHKLSILNYRIAQTVAHYTKQLAIMVKVHRVQHPKPAVHHVILTTNHSHHHRKIHRTRIVANKATHHHPVHWAKIRWSLIFRMR